MSIRLEQVDKRFGNTIALRDVSLDIEPGEFFVVLGPSGCGKSTLLRLIAGLERVDAGCIAIAGQPVSASGLHRDPEERGVGVVFQSYALWPHMTVREHAAFPLEVAGVGQSDARAQIQKSLHTVGLTELAERYPDALSGGQRQRVALARCLAQGARVILMDEPLANLDPHLRASMEQELSFVQRQTDTTMFFITHDQREAMALADRIAVMDRGRVLQVDRPDNLYRCPVNAMVAGFIGEGSLLDAECEAVMPPDGSRQTGSAIARVRVHTSRFHVRCRESCRPGPVRLLLRPEALDWAAAGSVVEEALDIQVTGLTYRGGYNDVQAMTADGQTLLLRSDSAELATGRLQVWPRDGWVL